MICRQVKFIPLPNPVWEAMKAGEVMKDLRKCVHWQYEADFDLLVHIFTKEALRIARELRDYHETTKTMQAKDVGKMLQNLPPAKAHVKALLFVYRTRGGNIFEVGKVRNRVFDFLKPVNNCVEGYFPSASMAALLAESLVA